MLEYETGAWHQSSMPLIDFGERDVDKWTLRAVVERGALAFECRKWWHLGAQLDVLELVARFGPEALSQACA